TTSSHFEDSQNTDRSYRDSQPDGTQVVDSQGPNLGEELHAILNEPGSADVDMEAHERRSTAPSRAGTTAAASTAPRERGDSEYEPSDAGEVEEDDSDGPVPNETLFPHLVYTADDPRHPAFNFSEIRDAALSGQAALPPNTALFELDNSFQPGNLKHVMLLRQGVRNRWKKLGGKQPLKVFPLPAAGRTRHVQVQFPTSEDFAWAPELVIYWKKKGYRSAAFGPALGPRYRIFSTQLPPTAPLDEAADAVFAAMPDHLQIVSLWGLNSGPENHPEEAEFTGHMVAVIYFPCAPGCENDPVPDDILLTLPGWVRFRGRDFETAYDGRGAWCRICRGRGDFHTSDECHHNTCNWCQGKHRTNDCPTNQDSQTSTDDATDLQEQVPPTTAKTTTAGTTTAGDRPVTPTSTTPHSTHTQTQGTPRTPSRSTLRNQTVATPGSSSSRTLVSDSPSLMDRLSKAPTTTKDRKGKGRQAAISDYLVPMGTKKTVPTAATLAPSKRSAPSTGTSASAAHINSRPRPYPAK
ncbi:unnamed protein product, partial [Tilletia laevis]